jgi:chloramphenicol-sensitive protein RarD
MQFWLVKRGEAYFGGTTADTLLLMGCGVMTSTALIFFAASLKLLRYSTAGLLQYISPTLVFLTAVFIFGEPMDKWRLLSFVILWIGLAVYSYSALRDEKNRRAEVAALS